MERTGNTPATEPLSFIGYWRCMIGIVWREGLRFLHQRGRFVAALVRPLVWLFIFAAGFRSVLGVSIIEPGAFIAPECKGGVPCDEPTAMPEYASLVNLQDAADLLGYLLELRQ